MTCNISKNKLLDDLKKEINLCKKCPLHLTRNIPLVSDGNEKASIMIIGEAPGYNEDLQNKAFIGKAGKILDQLLEHVNLSRNDIFITNILKCHPPQNKDPSPQEVSACIDYLYRQIKIIQPKIIITLGKFASKELFSKVHLPFTKISDLHGEIFEIKASYSNIKIIPLYHPSMACYNSSMIDTLMSDFKKTIGTLIINGESR